MSPADPAPTRLRRAALPLLVMAVLFAVSSVPVTIGPVDEEDAAPVAGLFSRIPPIVHNALHVPGYAVLAWTLFFAAGGRARTTSARVGAGARGTEADTAGAMRPGRGWTEASGPLAFAIVAATAYGALLELHQLQVPGRYASLGDVFLNLAGATAGALLARRFASRR